MLRISRQRLRQFAHAVRFLRPHSIQTSTTETQRLDSAEVRAARLVNPLSGPFLDGFTLGCCLCMVMRHNFISEPRGRPFPVHSYKWPWYLLRIPQDFPVGTLAYTFVVCYSTAALQASTAASHLSPQPRSFFNRFSPCFHHCGRFDTPHRYLTLLSLKAQGTKQHSYHQEHHPQVISRPTAIPTYRERGYSL